jgi:hypothetical protein
MRLQTLRRPTVGAPPGSSDPTLILFLYVLRSVDLDFNDYLHPLPYAQLSTLTQLPATAQALSSALSGREFFTSSVKIVCPVSGNSVGRHKHGGGIIAQYL